MKRPIDPKTNRPLTNKKWIEELEARVDSLESRPADPLVVADIQNTISQAWDAINEALERFDDIKKGELPFKCPACSGNGIHNTPCRYGLRQKR